MSEARGQELHGALDQDQCDALGADIKQTLLTAVIARRLSLPCFLSGVLAGGVLLWMMIAAWIELAPASVLPTDYGRGASAKFALEHCQFKDVLVLGDSKILFGLDRLSMPVSAQMFAEGGGNPAVDYYRTKAIVNCTDLPKLVVLSYSPLNIRHVDPWLIETVLMDKLLSLGDELEIGGRLETEGGGTSLATLSIEHVPDMLKAVGTLPFSLRALLYRTDFPPLYLASMQASLRSGLREQFNLNRMAAEDAVNPIGFDDWRTPGAPESETIFHDAAIEWVPRSKVIEEYYRRLVDRLADRGIIVLIAPIPVNEPTFQAIPQVVKDEYSAFLHALSAGHNNVTVIEPVWSIWPATSFRDYYGHANRVGEAEITRLINRCIASLLHPATSQSDGHGPSGCTMDHDAL